MQTALLPLLRCPMGCPNSLCLRPGAVGPADEVLWGTLDCRGCGAAYPVEAGIARMLPADLACAAGDGSAAAPSRQPAPGSDEAARKRTEMHARDEQVGDYDRMWYLHLFGLLEIPATLACLDLRPDHSLLEAGCGTGRMTRAFARRCRRMVSVDFSWESLRVCAGKLRRAGIRNVDLVQADVCRLPFAAGHFDRVAHCQVLEHVPTADGRAAAIECLARMLPPGGHLAVSAYKYSLPLRLKGDKQGEHDGGIPYFRFERGELRDLLSRSLRVDGMTGLLVYHYLARCTKV